MESEGDDAIFGEAGKPLEISVKVDFTSIQRAVYGRGSAALRC